MLIASPGQPVLLEMVVNEETVTSPQEEVTIGKVESIGGKSLLHSKF